MTMPLVVLGVLSIFGGLVGIPGKLFHHPEWNLIERFLEPILLPIGHAAEGGHDVSHHAVSLGMEWGLVFLSASSLVLPQTVPSCDKKGVFVATFQWRPVPT